MPFDKPHALKLDTDTETGSAWRRYQIARIQQVHTQLGGHFRLELDAVLRAVAARAARPSAVQAPARIEAARGDVMRWAWIEAIAHCARLDGETRRRAG